MKINSAVMSPVNVKTKKPTDKSEIIEDKFSKSSEKDELAMLKKQMKELQAKIEALEADKSDVSAIPEDKKELAKRMIKEMNDSSDISLIKVNGEHKRLKYSYCFSRGTSVEDRSYRKGLLEGKEHASSLVSDNMDSNEIFTRLEQGDPVFVKILKCKKRYNDYGGFRVDMKNSGRDSLTVKSFDDLNKVFTDFLKDSNITREEWDKTLEAEKAEEVKKAEIKNTMKYDEETYQKMVGNMNVSAFMVKTKGDKPINKIFCFSRGMKQRETSVSTGLFSKYKFTDDVPNNLIPGKDITRMLLEGRTLLTRVLKREKFTRRSLEGHYQQKELKDERIQIKDFNDLEKAYNTFLKENNLTEEEINAVK